MPLIGVLRASVLRGVNFTIIEQFEPCDRLVPQFPPAREKSPLTGLNARLMPVIVEFPAGLNSVMVRVVLEPRARLPNDSGFGDPVYDTATGAGVLVPLSAICADVAGAARVIDCVAAFAPTLVGLNTKVIVQLLPAVKFLGKELPQSVGGADAPVTLAN